MINSGDRPYCTLHGEELHRAIVSAMDTAIDLLERQLNKRPSIENVVKWGFFRLLGAQNHRPNVRFDERFVQACFDANQGDSRNTTSGTARTNLSNYLLEENLPAHGISALRRGLKLMLVELWRLGAVLLPTTFTLGAHFPLELFDHTLLLWVKSFDPAAQEDGAGVSDARRLYFYGPRLLFTTSWQTPGDISLEEMAELTKAYLLYERQLSPTVIAAGAQLPFTLVASKALEQFAGEVRFGAQDIKTYSRWVLSGSYEQKSLPEFSADARRPKPPRKARSPGAQKKESAAPEADFVDPESSGDVHEALRLNFKRLKNTHRKAADWSVHDLPVYVGREHVCLDELAPRWIEAMRAYMHQRTYVKGYRSSGEATSVLNILADYLFFYLPWWLELAGTPKVGAPTSPRDFARFAFVARHTVESPDDFPETLLTVIGWRRKSKETIAVAVNQLSLFFAFVETHFAEDEAVAGANFRSPLSMEFDAPRVPKSGKTNKVVIPKHLYSFLLFYSYAVEQAGMKLEELALEGKLPEEKTTLLLRARWLRPADFGFEVRVRHRNNDYLLEEIPNVFQWGGRTTKANAPSPSKSGFFPHCSALRLLVTSLETGLRCQSVQWLDRNSWKRELSRVSPDSYVFPLLVNTDKTKVHPWVTQMVFRVRDTLQRQETFQAQFADADAFEAVLYEGSAEAPFDPIEPLFRSVSSGVPVSDNIYQEAWRLLMVGFEEFFRTATGEQHVRMHLMRPLLDEEGKPQVRVTKNTDLALYCPLSLLAVHTPHACRATFATNRRDVLDLTDVAALIGHGDAVTTAHYTNPSLEDLDERLKASDQEINQDFLQFDAVSEVHVRADKPDSTLVRNFSVNRAATIKAFGFIPSVTLWSTEDSNDEGEGLRLLRDGPMSRIRFRETHICPVGEECPADIIERIGEPRRCGSCPLAMRCVEHLPAIAAKQNQLLERIRYLHARWRQLEAQGEPASVLDEAWDALELDVNEYLGWQLSEEVLNSKPLSALAGDNAELHVEMPDVVRRHLHRVSRSGSTAELMLQRIADSNAYPSMSTPQVERSASQIKRRLLAGLGTDALPLDNDEVSSVREVATMLSIMMKTSGVSREQVALALSTPKSSGTPRQIRGGSNDD